MKYYLTLIISISVLWLFPSCSSNSTVEARRQFAIKFEKENWAASSKNVVRSKWSKDISSALISIDTKTINNPRMASAVLAKGKDENYGLIIFWIENHPSVDGVEFQFNSQSSPVIIPIPDAELKQNQSAAKETIVFGSELQWEDTSEVWKSLEQITGAKDLKVRLLRDKAPVTDWFSVDFYKVDHWIPQ